MTATGLGETLAYDAENRLTSYTISSKYSPQSRRGQKVAPTVTETYVYDAFGRLAAEYSTAAPSAGGTCYRTTDHLGSRSSNNCFAASFDGRHQFTGQERDEESDLDYFGARYFGATLGRFLSADPGNAGARTTNPQSWNGYAYVGNNPLAFIDPLGLFWIRSGDGSINWTDDDCTHDANCFSTLAVGTSEGITVYGSEHDDDIKMFGVNAAGLVDVDKLSGHPDAAFEVKQNTAGKFLSPETAADLFTATAAYSALLPGSPPILMTGGSTAAGASAVASRQSHKGGKNIDFRYVDKYGNPIQREDASERADPARMKTLFEAFGREGLPAALTGTPGRFGFKPYRPDAQLKHLNHVHLQYNYPEWPPK